MRITRFTEKYPPGASVVYLLKFALLFAMIILMSKYVKAGKTNLGESRDEIPEAVTDISKAFPNAIHISSGEIEELMNGNDPYGLLNYLSLQTGLTFRSTGD